MFCVNCGEKIPDNYKYCSNCGTQTSSSSLDGSFAVPKSKLEDGPSSSSTTSALPSDFTPVAAGASFSSCKREKSNQWFNKTRKKGNKSAVKINIGLFQWNINKQGVGQLKKVRGQKIALETEDDVNYERLLESAEVKWKNFQPMSSSALSAEFVLLYENGTKADSLPGTDIPFVLKSYKKMLLKDYKQIILYLCNALEYNIQENNMKNERKQVGYECLPDISSFDKRPRKNLYEEKIPDTSESDDDDFQSPGPLRKKIKKNKEKSRTEILPDFESDDRKFAESLQSLFDQEQEDVIYVNKDEEEFPIFTKTGSGKPIDVDTQPTSILETIAAEVDKTKQFFICLRRKCEVFRVLKIWSREANLSDPEGVLRVKFISEPAIDTGAVAKEFLTNTIDSIKSSLFPNGNPADSISHIQQNYLKACAQISSVSLAQGGPPPLIMSKATYELFICQDEEFYHNEQFLSADEKDLLQRVKENLHEHEETILSNGYTGIIAEKNIETILGTIKINILNKKKMFLDEFRRGLLYGLGTHILKNSKECEKYFVFEGCSDGLSASYIFGLMEFSYSEIGTSLRVIEDRITDFMQDFLCDLEDKCIANMGTIQDIEIIESGDEEEECEKKELETDEARQAELKDLFFWLTALKHKPLNGEVFSINVYFNHACTKKNQNHTICFPVVQACSQTITLPVAHLRSVDEFRSNLITAINNSQGFSRV